MGLDQYIYEHHKDREAIELRLEKLLDESNDYAIELSQKPEIQAIIKTIVDKYEKHMYKDGDLLSYMSHKVRSILYGNNDFEETRWDLFNNCSKFKFELDGKIKDEITRDILDMLKPYPVSEAQRKRLEEESKLNKQLSDMQTEVAYWRKFHLLNDYMLQKYNADNCEYTKLSKKDMEDIRDFICTNNEDPNQVINILKNWDDEKIYLYFPWW